VKFDQVDQKLNIVFVNKIQIFLNSQYLYYILLNCHLTLKDGLLNYI